jgi:uncharacterized protein YhaN
MRLEDIKLRLTGARSECERYRAVLEEEEGLETRMRELSARAEELRREKSKLQDLIDLWPVWLRRTTAERRRSSLPLVEEFPAQAAVRLAEGRNRIAAARERWEGLDSELRAREQQRDTILPTLQPSLVSIAPVVAELGQSVTLHRKNLREYSQAARTVEEAQRSLNQKLVELGSGWDERRLEQFDVSLPQREEIRQFSDAVSRARARQDETERMAQHRARELEQRQREAERVRQKRDAIQPLEAGKLAASEQAVRRLRAGLANLASLEARLESLAAATRERRAAVDERREEIGSAIPRWLPFVLYAAAALALASGVWQLLGGVAGLGGPLIGVGLVCAIAAIAFDAMARRSDRQNHIRAENTQRLEAELQEFQAAEQKCRDELGTLQAALQSDAAVAGLASPVSADLIEAKAAELETQRAAQAEWRRLDEALTEAAQRCAELDVEAAAAWAEGDQARKAVAAAEAAWAARKSALGVSEALSPEGLFQFFAELERTRDLMRVRDQRRVERIELESQVRAWEDRVRRELRIAGRDASPFLTGEDLLSRFAALQRDCAEQVELERRLAALEAEIVTLSRQRDAARASLERCEMDWKDLFRQAGVTDEAEFHRKMAVFEERKVLGQEIATHDNAIRTRLGEQANLAAFLAVLSEGNLQGWTGRLAEAGTELERANAERDQAVREHEAVRQRRVAVERSADVPAFEWQLEAARLELGEAVRRWRLETLAAALLQETLADFQRNRQPAVITEAGRFFGIITGGRYTRLLPQEDGQTLLVQLAGEETRHLEELSRGTAEQLYLCLRLAFAREFARRGGGALPVVMDDVLVNFDPARARAVARVLTEFAATNQVLLFTCHPDTASLFEEFAPGHVRVELAGPAKAAG